jgi:DNA repair exonuclease SbcCD ATPase subunit
MNETLTSFLVVFSEIGLLLALVAIIIAFFVLRRKHRDNVLARQVVETLRESEGARKANLMDIMQKVHDMDEEFAEQTAQAMLSSEKRIYNRVLKIFLGHERNGITDLQRDVENMATTYRKLIDSIKAMHVTEVERGDNPKREAQMRLHIKQLEAEKQKLQEDLDESMASMENMLKEYTQMYAGGGARKEGVKHIENELVQLKRKIAENLVEEVGEEGEVPDVAPDENPDADPDDKEKPVE